MRRRPPRSTRTYTLFPSTTLFDLPIPDWILNVFYQSAVFARRRTRSERIHVLQIRPAGSAGAGSCWPRLDRFRPQRIGDKRCFRSCLSARNSRGGGAAVPERKSVWTGTIVSREDALGGRVIL